MVPWFPIHIISAVFHHFNTKDKNMVMGFELFCATMIGLLFGAVICFGGYRFFLFLLPIWGFFFGFGLGAQSVQALLGDAFFGTVTSWVVGFILALIFAVLSYLFYFVAVALIAGSLGYGLVVALMGAIGMNFGFLTWIIGVVVAVALAFVTLRFNLAKYVIIIATALGGAAMTIGTLVMGVSGVSVEKASSNLIGAMFETSPFWSIIFIIMAVAGAFVQWRSSQLYTLEPYENRI